MTRLTILIHYTGIYMCHGLPYSSIKLLLARSLTLIGLWLSWTPGSSADPECPNRTNANTGELAMLGHHQIHWPSIDPTSFQDVVFGVIALRRDRRIQLVCDVGPALNQRQVNRSFSDGEIADIPRNDTDSDTKYVSH